LKEEGCVQSGTAVKKNLLIQSRAKMIREQLAMVLPFSDWIKAIILTVAYKVFQNLALVPL
jgi:hypothetical protein